MSIENIKERIARFGNHRIVIIMAMAAMGVMFILSAGAKLPALGQFELTLIQQNVVSDRFVAAYLARFVIVVELFLGLCYFQRHYIRRLILPSTFLLLAGFTFYLIYLSVFLDYKENCGCFGDLIQLSPTEAIAKNIVFLFIVFYLFRTYRHDSPERWPVPFSIAIVSLLVVFLFFPVKIIGKSDIVPTVSDAARQSESGSKVSVNKPAPPSRFAVFNRSKEDGSNLSFTSGKCLAAFLSLDCDHCMDVARQLGAMPSTGNTKIYFIFFGEEEQVPEFFAETNTNFPYILSTPDQFFNFIGNAPPRLYLLDQGNIRKFWDLDDIVMAEIMKQL